MNKEKDIVSTFLTGGTSKRSSYRARNLVLHAKISDNISSSSCVSERVRHFEVIYAHNLYAFFVCLFESGKGGQGAGRRKVENLSILNLRNNKLCMEYSQT